LKFKRIFYLHNYDKISQVCKELLIWYQNFNQSDTITKTLQDTVSQNTKI